MGTNLLQPGQPDPRMDPKFRSGSLPAIVTFGFDSVAPPSPLYVQRDDQLLLEAASSAVDSVIFNIRMLMAPFPQGGQPDDLVEGQVHGKIIERGVIEPSTQIINFTVAQPNNLTTLTVPLAEGYLLAVSAVSSSQRSRGITFARAMLVRGQATFTSANAFVVLFADYPTNNAPVGWPYGRQLHPSEGPGAILRATIANPGAGADFTFQPADALRWRVQSLTAQLTTSAAVGNRQVSIQVLDSAGNFYFAGTALQVQAASASVNYTFAPGLTAQAIQVGSTIVSLPANLILAQRHQLKSVTAGILAGDQWSLISMGVEQLEDLI